MRLSKKNFAELAWVLIGQACTAGGALVGVRLLTGVTSPSTFGAVSLSVGVCGLVVTFAAAPLIQAAMFNYPTFSESGDLKSLRDALSRTLRRMLLPLIALAIILAGLAAIRDPLLGLLVLASSALVLAECAKSLGLSLLASARRQKLYAIWAAIDALARPALAALSVVALGQSAILILLVYALVSTGLWLTFKSRVWAAEVGIPRKTGAAESTSLLSLDSRLWRYAVALMPLGVIAWASNLGDRYVIGAIMGVDYAGLYAAAYGISSAPPMIIGGTIEQALRPIHQNAVARGEARRASLLLKAWLGAVVIACGLWVAGIQIWHTEVANLLLGQEFRQYSHIMPWISGGYALRSVGYVFERLCYANGETRRVLLIQSIGAIATLIALPIGVYTAGIVGAAIATTVSFLVQMMAAIVIAAPLLGVRKEVVAQP